MINNKITNSRGIKNNRISILPTKLTKKFIPKIGTTISMINE